MGIFSRFSDIVNSNINALLDKAEDPEKMVRLIIQEMEDTLVEVRSSSAKVIAEKKELTRNIERIEADAQQWQQKAELALDKEREDLARAALVEREKALDSAELIKQQLEQIESHLTQLQQETAQLQEKLADAKSRQKTIVMRQQTVATRLEVKRSLHNNKVDEALHRFERYESKIDGIEAEIESYEVGQRSLADEITQLESESKIDDQLAALKQQMKDKQQD